YEVFAFQLTCATFDDWNGAILAAGFTPTHAHFLPPDRIAFQATPVNLGTPVTPVSFDAYIRGPNDVPYYAAMSVDPDSGDLFIGGGNVFDRIQRGTPGVVQQYQVPGTNAIGFAFGEPTSITTQLTLTVPSSIVQGDETQFATVA